LNGKAIAGRDEHGRRIVDDSFLLLFNAHSDAIEWIIPPDYGNAWELILNTSRRQPVVKRKQVAEHVVSQARSVVVLQAP
jgi:glycogen operon protein